MQYQKKKKALLGKFLEAKTYIKFEKKRKTRSTSFVHSPNLFFFFPKPLQICYYKICLAGLLLVHPGPGPTELLHLSPENSSLDQSPDSPAPEPQVLPPNPSRHLLVQVAIEGHPLHVLVPAQLHQRLPPDVAPIEHLLEQVKEPEHDRVPVVPLPQVLPHQVLFSHHPLPLPRPRDGLPAHPPGLGSEVDPFPRALGHVPRRVPHEGHPPPDPPRARVLRYRVRLHLDHLSSCDLRLDSRPHPRLVLLDVGLRHDGARADRDVVALREDPAVEVRGDVASDVHLR
ncbi:geranylgeranyl diphosphate reductase, chloroplastic-like [Iris pallida]|uniref:Geranylgeranyl diphosphate reductase, chloroplastic-like n=1 Tax=Iris pallida TaxID=29817 RepID=A0AAX6HBM7_IRIPA|nr:geranylgeranyl diphosphate reductase, chloroplastic-like [Iris pallida]